MGHLFLIGFMGAGKSTVAATLAQLLGRRHVDTDDMITAETGMTIADIFAQKGEQYFREVESKVLAEIEPAGDLVIATGGGCIERPGNLESMKRLGTTIYLKTSWDDIVGRIAGSTDRPLASAEDGWQKTRTLFRKRLPLYESADIIIDTTAKSPEEISGEIVDRLGMQS